MGSHDKDDTEVEGEEEEEADYCDAADEEAEAGVLG